MKNERLVVKGFDIPLDYLRKNSPKNNKVSYLSLETKPICNAKCLYCFAGPELGNLPKNSLTSKEYKKIISQAKDLGVRTVVFPGVGEPTLDEKLTDLVKFNYKNNLTSIIYTNGLFDSNLVKFFHKHNTSLLLKLDTLKLETYKKLIGGNYNKFRKSLNKIIEIYKPQYNKENKTRLGAGTLVTNINKEEIKELSNFCKSYKIKHFVSDLHKVGHAKDNWKQLVGGNINELNQIVSKYKTGISSGTLDNDKCGLFYYGITLDINGDLIGCPTARWIRLSNIRKNSLRELIKEQKQQILFSKEHFCIVRALAQGGK